MKYQDYRAPRKVKRGTHGCLTEGMDKFYAKTPLNAFIWREKEEDR